MIPKLIHQTAKTSELPIDCRAYVAKLKTLHPDWKYQLWTDDDNLAFVKEEFPDFLDTFQAYPRNIMRADVIRYLIMYRLGGFYLDTDYEMLKAFDLCENEIVLCWEPNPQSPDKPLKIANAIFASSPGHPFFGMLIDQLKRDATPSQTADVEMTTGPGFVTRVFGDAVQNRGLRLEPTAPILFSPITPRNEREYQAIVQNGKSYGIHHCFGTWRSFSLAQRIKLRLKWLLSRYL